MILLSIALACSGSKDDSAAEASTETDTGTTSDTTEPSDTTTEDTVDTSICADDYSFCGQIIAPTDFQGTPRSLAVALYDSIPPAGPPIYTVAEIDAPALVPGDSYEIAIHPVTAVGEYYVWFNMYMEGGGEWIPVNGVDYTGATAGKLTFDGSPIGFEAVTLEVASGW